MGGGLSRGLLLLSWVALAHILGKKEYGELAIIQSTVGMFGILAGFGLGMASTRYVAEFRRSDPHKAGRVMALTSLGATVTGAVSALLLGGLAPWLATRTLAAPHLVGELRVGALLLFLTGLNGAQVGAISGFESFKALARINLITGICSFVVLVGGGWVDGLRGTVWGLVIGQLVMCILSHLALRKESARYGIPMTYAGCMKESSVLWRFCLPGFLAGSVVSVGLWACNTLLVNQPGGYEELGVFNAVQRMKQTPEMVLGLLMMPLLPVLSETLGRKQYHSYARVLRMAFGLSFATIVPVVLLQVSAPMLTLLPFGKSFMGHGSIVQWLMLQGLLTGLFQPFSSILASLNRMWFGFTYNVLSSLLFLALAYLLVPAHHGAGLAAAYGIAHMSTTIPCVLYIRFREPHLFQGLPLGSQFLMTLLLFGCCVAASLLLSPIAAAFVGLVAVIGCLMLLFRFMRHKQEGPTPCSSNA